MGDCRGHHPDDETPPPATPPSIAPRPDVSNTPAAYLHLRQGTPHWCDACTTRIHHALDRITSHLGDIHTHAHHGRTNTPSDQTGTRTTGTRTTPTPSPVWDLTDETLRWLTNWADTIADTQGHHGPRRARRDGRDTVTAATLIAYLSAQLPTALTHPDYGADLGAEIMSIAARLETAAGTKPHIERIPSVRCPYCRTLTLYRADGTAQIDCWGCGRAWPDTDYTRLKDMVIAEL